ncbi:PASTA domain-containing protein [Actinomadura sp. 21ATH]|uniref:PASTA domain-containing protein n=1 Tax=Actinomadura sp. 21ATH TaxID=1735444 RepID=UPI0035C1297B
MRVRVAVGVLGAVLVLAGCGGPGTAPDGGAVAVPSGKVQVPNVVGRAPQEALDTMRTAGFRSLVEKSAGRGAERVVVRQDPPAGSVVPVDGTVTLYSGTLDVGRPTSTPKPSATVRPRATSPAPRATGRDERRRDRRCSREDAWDRWTDGCDRRDRWRPRR